MNRDHWVKEKKIVFCSFFPPFSVVYVVWIDMVHVFCKDSPHVFAPEHQRLAASLCSAERSAVFHPSLFSSSSSMVRLERSSLSVSSILARCQYDLSTCTYMCIYLSAYMNEYTQVYMYLSLVSLAGWWERMYVCLCVSEVDIVEERQRCVCCKGMKKDSVVVFSVYTQCVNRRYVIMDVETKSE